MIFKEILPSNIFNKRTFANQLIDIIQEDISGSSSRKTYQVFVTGGIGPGVTSSLFQTVYDQDHTLQTANALFDLTIGLNPNGTTISSSLIGKDTVGKEIFPSSTLMAREKMDIHRQFAQTLLGDVDGQFYSPYDSTSSDNLMDSVLFINFRRLFARDQIKRETFAMKFYQTASAIGPAGQYEPNPGVDDDYVTNLNVTTEDGSTIYTDVGSSNNKLVSFGGLVGNVVNSANTDENVGLMFYDRGVLALDLSKIASGSQFVSGSIDAVNAGGTTIIGGAGTETDKTAKFIPDLMMSASIDDILDYIAATRFSSGSVQTAITFQNVTNINSTLVFCRASADEFNYSSNPTFVDADSRIVVIEDGAEDTQQSFTFITGIGLYDSNDNLLAIGKTSRPIEKNGEKEISIRLRLDF